MSKVFPFLALAAIAAGILTFRLLDWGSEEIGGISKARQVEAQPQPQPLPEAVVKGAGRMTLDDLKAFDRFPVFWLGPQFKGHPVTAIIYRRSAGSPDGLIPPEETVDIVYGTCDLPEEGPLEGRVCVPPLAIISEPLCYNPPGRLAPRVRQGPQLEIRGGQVQLVQSPTGDTHFYFGASTVQILAEGQETTLEAFEHYLQGVNPSGLAVAARAGAPLPAPISAAECANFRLPPIQALPTPTAAGEPDAPTSTPTATPTATPWPPETPTAERER